MWKKIAIAAALLVLGAAALLVWLVINASAFIGPAYPEKDGRAYLERKAYAPPVIEQVIALQALDATTFSQLAKEDSTDVRFLVAQNPFLPAALLQQLAQDSSDFVRGGAALNPHLTPLQIQQLSADPSPTTQIYVARNPYIPEADLLRLHEVHGIELVWFAMNPNCPQVLKDKMRTLNDEDALYWLNVTETEQQEGDEASDEEGEEASDEEGENPVGGNPATTESKPQTSAPSKP